MKIHRIATVLIVSTFVLLVPSVGFTQITSGASAILPTEYSSGAQDNIHVFCGAKGDRNASLIATVPDSESGTFEWQILNQSGRFDLFLNDLSGSRTSTISNLADGCYRVNITSTSGVKSTFTAWAFNNFIEAKAEITGSDCKSFTLNGAFEPVEQTFVYIDLTTGQPKNLNKNIKVRWLQGSTEVSTVITYKIYSPPTKNTDYTLEVSDRFDCIGQTVVQYQSIVTKASFEYKLDEQKSDKKLNEAPLTATFTNTSENGDPGKYEWFIFKDLQKIKLEKEAGTFKDSILEVIYSDNPVYVFEETGQYKVKLVSKNATCTDTFYMEGYIVADESFLDAPNVFTPGNGDDVNNTFAIKFFSMKTVKISIFNRWGKLIHVWQSNNVRGFYNTAMTVPESVWDGKVGGRLATPGVYYYVAEGMGRDDKKRSATGFFHLFRGK